MEEGKDVDIVVFEDLTENRLQDALSVFKIGGWSEGHLIQARTEMLASVRGGIDGYICSRFVLASAGDQVVGVSAWAPSTCSFEVYELSWATVLPEWRHRGINSVMLKERLRRIKLFHGSEPFEVIVYTWNNPMYERAGFLPCGLQNIGSKDLEKKRLLLAKFPAVEGCLF